MIWLLGFLTPILPVVGGHYLLGVGLFCLVICHKDIKFNRISWGLPYLWLGIVWAACLYYWGGFYLVFYLNYLVFCANLFLLLGMFSILSGQKNLRQDFKMGMLVGLSLALVAGSLEVAFKLNNYFPNQNAYWNSLGRIAATFTDPNAFGIFAVLALALLWQSAKEAASFSLQRWLLIGIALVLLILVCFSGSRSFYLGVALYLIIFLWQESRIFLLTAFILGMLCIYLGLTGSLVDPELPIGLQRLFAALDFNQFNATFFSRLVFWKIGWQIWLDNLVLGVGLENFRNLVPEYSNKLGLGIGNWTDNSNNFYLGTLAELGLLGGIALGFVFTKLRFKSDAPQAYKNALMVLLVLLFFGPHLSFVEVSILTAFVMASSLEIRPTLGFQDLQKQFMVGFCLVALVAIPVRSRFVTIGLYPSEIGEGGQTYNWTTNHARILLKCQEGQAKFSLRATNPDLMSKPVEVKVNFLNDKQTLVLNDYSFKQIVVSCPSEAHGMLEAQTSRSWRPLDFNLGPDARQLGVQFYSNASIF